LAELEGKGVEAIVCYLLNWSKPLASSNESLGELYSSFIS